jgi:hypothetical protein
MSSGIATFKFGVEIQNRILAANQNTSRFVGGLGTVVPSVSCLKPAQKSSLDCRRSDTDMRQRWQFLVMANRRSRMPEHTM